MSASESTDPFLEQGERKAPIPEGLPPDELDLARSIELFDAGQVEEEPLGTHPESGKPIYIKVGRFGPYIQLGAPDDDEKRNQSLLKGMTIEDLTLEMACKLLELPRTLGNFPTTTSRSRLSTAATGRTSNAKRKPVRFPTACRRWR